MRQIRQAIGRAPCRNLRAERWWGWQGEMSREDAITASNRGRIPGALWLAHRGFASSAEQDGGPAAMALARALWRPYSGLKVQSIYDPG